MINTIDPETCTEAAKIKLGLVPKPAPKEIGLGHIVSLNLDDEKQLIVEAWNGALFSCGVLSDNQRQQTRHIASELIGCKIYFKFERLNELKQPVNAQFYTLLIHNDPEREKAITEKLATMDSGVRDGQK